MESIVIMMLIGIVGYLWFIAGQLGKIINLLNKIANKD